MDVRKTVAKQYQCAIVSKFQPLELTKFQAKKLTVHTALGRDYTGSFYLAQERGYQTLTTAVDSYGVQCYNYIS